MLLAVSLAYLICTSVLINAETVRLTRGLYNIDTTQITLSGISSGAAMATQLHVAYSSVFSGSGSIAGPPYYCAQGSVTSATTTCMSPLITQPSAATLAAKANSYALLNQIDSTSNLRNHRTYFYSGSMDFTVKSSVVKVGEDFFANYMSRVNMKGVYTYASAHGHITDNYGSSCSLTNSQYYMNNCNYNQAYDMLSWLHPNEQLVKPASTYKPTGQTLRFDQTEFFPAGSASSILMDNFAYLYVPTNCLTQKCKLHIALHGCLQGAYKIGTVYVDNAGYNQVADLNNFVILYPQAISSILSNPNGCWDWWGFTNANYATKQGLQMQAIRAMVNRLAF